MTLDNIVSKHNRDLLDRLSQPVFYLSKEFKFCWANTNYCDYMRLPLEKLLKMELADVIPDEYVPSLKGRFTALTPEKNAFNNIYPSLLENGSIYVEKWHNEAVFDDNGNLLYYYCVGSEEGSDSKQSYSLNNRELISNTLIKNTLLGIIITIDGKINFVNKKAFELFMIKTIDAEGLTIREFFQLVNPDWNVDHLAGKNRELDSISTEIVMKETGSKNRWISMIKKAQTSAELNTTLYIFEDITDRKVNEFRTEKARRNLLEVMKFAKVGYWEKDYENNCWLWSDEIYEIYGITPGTKITESVLEKHFTEDSIRRRKNKIDEVQSQDKNRNAYRIEYNIITAQGENKWISGQSFYEKDPTGGNPKFYGWTQDITARKNLETTLREAKRKAEESERLKTAFLANMSHEIRTPLNAILGFSELLDSTDDKDTIEKYKQIIQNSSSLLLKIIDDILDFAAIESGKFELYYENVSLNEILSEVRHIYQNRAEEDVELQIEMPEQDIELSTDRERFKQIFINLINNAYKYTNDGTIKVNYRAEDQMLIFSVKDTGIGIPEDFKKHIFERFYQVNNFSKGTGLGLSITKTIIDQMGGEIKVESVSGEGSEFIFHIPMKK